MTPQPSVVRRHAWLVLVLGTVPLVIAYVAVPAVDPSPWSVHEAQRVLPLVIVLAGVAGVLVGIAINRPVAPRAWLLFAGALLVAGLADLGLAPDSAAGESQVSPAEAFYLVAYACLFVGVFTLVRRVSPGRDRSAILDAAIIGTAAALTSWVFLVQPLSAGEAFANPEILRAAVFPILDVLIFVAAVRVWFTVDGGRNRSMQVIVLTLLTLLVTDTTYSTQVLHGTWSDAGLWQVGWFTLYVGIGAAALHPSVGNLLVRSTAEREITWWRFVLLLGLMAVLPLALLLSQVGLVRTPQGAFVLLGALVMFALVMLRLNELVKQLRETLRRERVIRDANADLAASVDVAEIRTTAVRAAAELVAGGTAWLVGLRRQGSHGVVMSASQGGSGLTLRRTCVEVMDAICDQSVFRYGPSPLHQDLGVPPEVAFLAQPLTDSVGGREGFLLLAAPAPPRETAAALTALADAAELARSRVGLGKVMAERDSDRRLGRMLQHSTDIIVVLDIDLSVRYLSPGAERLIGPAPEEVLGASWLELVLTADQPLARDLVEHSAPDRPARGELRLASSDGSQRYVEVVVAQVLEEDEPGYVLTCHDVTERRALEQQLTHQAFHDALTGLANRSLFRDRLEHAITRASRTASRFAVLFIDLDDFKDVNDSLGHAAGDMLLQQVALRLVDAVREQDTVARLGGDEFAVLLESVEDEAETDAVAQRIVEMADEPISVGTSHLSVAMSVGIAMTDGGVSTAEEAMRNADLALYEAKSLGKNQHAVFAPAMHEQAVDRLQLMAELRHGLDNDRLLVHFQPIVDMQDGHQVGVEALARWRHPTRGMIGPEQFIPLAEETGLIVPLGRTVMRQALETVAGWHAQVPGCETIGVSVNLSVRQLVHPEVVADVRRALDDSGIDPRTVVLEITESVLHPGEGVTLDRLHELTSLGVRLFIDDFGTGYSSLNYLQQLPVSGIKLAREFVSTLGSTSSAAAEMTESAGGLVSTIRVLAETLGLEAIIAEGVETPEQRDALVDLGYRLGQGFLMARPMSGPAMRTHLEERAASVLGLTVG